MLTILGLFIWGCRPIFEVYGYWRYDFDPDDPWIYCAYTPFMFAFVMLILYGILVGVIAICFSCFCCFFWCVMLCCYPDEDTTTEGYFYRHYDSLTRGTSTGATGFIRRSMSATSETANACNRNLQSHLQRLPSFGPNAGAHSLRTPNTVISQGVPATNNNSPTVPSILPMSPLNATPNVVIDMQLPGPVSPIQEPTAPEDLPPSYEEAI